MITKIFNTFFTRILSSALSFLVVILTSRELGAEIRGEISLLTLGITIIQLFSGVYAGSVLVYFASRQNIGSLLKYAYISSLICSVIISIPVYLIFHDSINYIHLAILSFLGGLIQANQHILLGRSKLKSFNLLQMIQPISLLIGLFVFIYIIGRHNLESYIISLYVSFIITVLISLMNSKEFLYEEQKGRKRPSILRQGIQIQTAAILQLLNYRLSYIVILKTSGTFIVGVFSNAVIIAEAVWLFSKSIATVFYSHVSTSEKSENELQKETIKYTGTSMVATSAILLPLVIIPEHFYLWVLGDDFTGIKTIITCLAPGIIFLSGSTIITHYFSGRGQNKINTVSSAIGLVLTMLPGIPLILYYGPEGGALAGSISYLGSAIYLYFQFRKQQQKKL